MESDSTFDKSSEYEIIVEKVDFFVEYPNVDSWSFNNFGKRNKNTSVEINALRELQQYLNSSGLYILANNGKVKMVLKSPLVPGPKVTQGTPMGHFGPMGRNIHSVICPPSLVTNALTD